MNRRLNSGMRLSIFLLFSLVLVISVAGAVEKAPLTFQDIMKFKEIRNPVLSEDGLWLAYGTQPDRGDGEAVVHDLRKGKVYTIDRGSDPVISKNSRWVAVIIKPKAVELERANKKKPKQGMAFLNTETGEVVEVDAVERFALSDDSKWLVYHHFKEEKKPEKEEKAEKEEKEKSPNEEKEKEKKKRRAGSTLVLRHLDTQREVQVPWSLSFAIDSSSRYLAYAVACPEGKENGLYTIDLKEDRLPQKSILKEESGLYTNLSWTKEGSKLAFLAGVEEDKDIPTLFSLWVWDVASGKAQQAVAFEDVPQDWVIPEKNNVSWTEDGKRVFFGFRPKDIHEWEVKEKEKKKKEDEAKEKQKEAEEEDIGLFDVEKILEKRELDVWHWNDPLINTHQKSMWSRLKDRTYMAVYHLDSNQMVQLADKGMPIVQASENPDFALGISDMPYQKEITWYGRLQDVYLVNLKDGQRQKIASRLEDLFSLSPGGRYLVYYKDKHWYLFDGKTGGVRNLTERLKVPLFDEDHDYPSKIPSYRIAGWVEGDEAVIIYDKYDIWQFETKTGQALNITGGEGRKNSITFRVLRLDPEARFFGKRERLLLSSYNNHKKNYGFFASQVGNSGVQRLLEEEKRFRFLAKAKKADVLMYTRESYQEFPDIWISDLKFASSKKASNVNPQISRFAWGSAELVEWRSVDGISLQGVLIKPGNYQSGKRYPVIVYFYRFFSQRLHEFNQMVINHRPNFPFYASNGYALFLPDIRFEVGRPGFSATKCLVPGVQKLIDMGVADPKAIGLHGHSWSGYQTAFVITQTDIFACAIAGAPVSNMTSAYSGIRWETGLARQFQYEQSQSRIGGSLWEYPERYIENSPVFFADRINTPLFIQFGDKDGAVPWYQGIELYLAMRRLGKDCVFLQYRNEPHHLRKYSNKLDYSIKMKQYFDHYLKGEPAPDWIVKGIPYQGK